MPPPKRSGVKCPWNIECIALRLKEIRENRLDPDLSGLCAILAVSGKEKLIFKVRAGCNRWTSASPGEMTGSSLLEYHSQLAL